MAVNKNFVVKNGLEVNTKLILADANTNKVGVGSTAPRFELDVAGGIGATDLYVSGVGTFANELNVGTDGSVLTVLGIGGSIGVGTADPGYLLDIRSPVSTGQTALYIQGDVQITGDLKVDDILLDDATLSNLTVTEAFNVTSPGLSTFSGYVYIDNSLEISTDLNVVGLTTLGGYVDINDDVDISGTLNVVGVSTLGGYVDINDSIDVSTDLNVVGLTTLGGYVDINNSVDISNNLIVTGVSTFSSSIDANSTANFQGDVTLQSNLILGDNDEIQIGTLSGGDLLITHLSSTNNSLIRNKNTAGSFIIDTATGSPIEIRHSSGGEPMGIFTPNGSVELYYDNSKKFETTSSGVSISGIVTASSGIVTYYGDGSELLGVIGGIGIGTTGGTLGFGVTFLNFFGAGVSTTQYESSVGIATIFFEGGGGGSISISTVAPALPGAGDLWYSPDYGRTFIYYDETVVGYGTDAYWVDAAPFNVGSISTLTGPITIIGDLNVTGIVTAQDFDALSDRNYKENVTTIDSALSKVENLRGVKFDWKESGNPSYGVIAQELEQVLPELVHGSDPKTVNYNGIIGVLIEAIKELKQEVKELKSHK
jgi:hypothetical protein